jgi:hypothetical protein
LFKILRANTMNPATPTNSTARIIMMLCSISNLLLFNAIYYSHLCRLPHALLNSPLPVLFFKSIFQILCLRPALFLIFASASANYTLAWFILGSFLPGLP